MNSNIMEKLSPMMEAYLATKEEYKDAILFYRLGDFYEMFFEDAITASKELELVLTGKSCGLSERAPMCGVPHASVDSYVNVLTDRGYKVAICEQVEDPKSAKGLVKREVVRVVTPGTNISGDSDSSRFISCIVKNDDSYGMSFCDVSTGEFMVLCDMDMGSLVENVLKMRPLELILSPGVYMEKEEIQAQINYKPCFFMVKNIPDSLDESREILSKHFGKDFSKEEVKGRSDIGIISGAALILYLYDTQKTDLSHIRKIEFKMDTGVLKIDGFTYKNLELILPLYRDDNKGSLFYCLDKTRTPMGRRKLKSIIKYPLTDKEEIENRLLGVEELCKKPMVSADIGEILKSMYDIHRIMGRIGYKNASPRDLLMLKTSLQELPSLRSILLEMDSKIIHSIGENLDPLSDIYELIESSIDEEAPAVIHDGNIIKAGYSEECDRLREASVNGKGLLSNLEEKERADTGIKNLKIRYNRVFGYYIEVTNSMLHMVPERYVRRQTLAGSERFYTEELKALEDTILGAKEKLDRLENELYLDVLSKIGDNINRIGETAENLAWIDCILSLSVVAVKNKYVKPTINTEGRIEIRGGRHPVVESMMEVPFIENDIMLNQRDRSFMLITGPNMAGKSTFMRMCAIITIMAQMGSFVPAGSADIGIVDRIFTRVGASDDLSSGASTFMVEMNEMASIINNATENSLIILDEIGRGTSTYDGLSIAWAVVEYFANLSAKTLFATHYHELTELGETLTPVINYCCAVKEEGEDIIFLRKILEGYADKSYGIQVASLAGVPASITDRAKEVLSQLISKNEGNEGDEGPGMSKGHGMVSVKNTIEAGAPAQLSFSLADSDGDAIKEELRGFDLNNSTPMDALVFLNKLKEKYK